MNLGFPEMLFIFILALLIFGPKKLPEIGRQVGKALGEFKRASNQFQAQIQVEINDLERAEQQKQVASALPAPALAANAQLTPAVPPAETVPSAPVPPAVAAAAQASAAQAVAALAAAEVPVSASEAKPPDA